MKFTVSQSSLMKALTVVAKGMGTNSTLPILSGIYVRAQDGTLEFQTNNLTISIRHLIPANVEEPGETVVSGKVITNIVKTLSDSAVTFEGSDRTITVSCDKSTSASTPSIHPTGPRSRTLSPIARLSFPASCFPAWWTRSTR